MLKIYGVPNSQPVRAVVWTCLMKELPFEFVMTSQNRDAKQPEFLASVNPRGTIPAIDDDGTVLWESHAILIYLCEKHGWHDLWPSEPEQRVTTLLPSGFRAPFRCNVFDQPARP